MRGATDGIRVSLPDAEVDPARDGDRYDVLAYADPDADDDAADRRRALEFGTWVAIALLVGWVVVADRSLALAAALAGSVYLGRVVVVRRSFPPSYETTHRAVPAGRGDEIVAAHEAERDRRARLRTAFLGLVVLAVGGLAVARGAYLAAAAFGGVVVLFVAAPVAVTDDEHLVPDLVATALSRETVTSRFETVTFHEDADPSAESAGDGPAGSTATGRDPDPDPDPDSNSP
jgi:hypothetical protein